MPSVSSIVLSSLRNDDRPVTFLQAISPIETVEDFSGPEKASERKQKISDHIESLSPRLNRVTYFKQVRNNMHNIRIQAAISLHFFICLQNRTSFRRRTDNGCSQSSLKVLSETFLAPTDFR